MARSTTEAAEQTMAQRSSPQESSGCCMMQMSSEKSWQGSAQLGWEKRGQEPAEFTEEVLQSVTESHGHPGPSEATWNPCAPVTMVCAGSPWVLNQEPGAQERAWGS